MLTAIRTGVVVALAGWARLHRWRGAAIGSGIALTTLAASVTGFLLPWDQLGLWAVTVGTSLRGYGVLFESSVKFVLIGGVEIQPATLLRWLAVHTLVLGPALVALVVFGWRRVSPRTTPETPARTPAR